MEQAIEVFLYVLSASVALQCIIALLGLALTATIIYIIINAINRS